MASSILTSTNCGWQLEPKAIKSNRTTLARASCLDPIQVRLSAKLTVPTSYGLIWDMQISDGPRVYTPSDLDFVQQRFQRICLGRFERLL
jgi:hypothetical protein